MAHLGLRRLALLLAAGALLCSAPLAYAQDAGKKGEEKKKEEGKKEEGKKEEEKKLTKEELKKLMDARKGQAKEALKKARAQAAQPMNLGTFIMSLEPIKHPVIVQYLKSMLNYQNLRQPGLVGQIRGAAAQTLSKMVENPKKGPVLYPALPALASKALKGAIGDRWNRKEEQGRQVMRASLEGMGMLQDKSAKKVLLKYMANPDPYLAESAIRGLGHLRDIDTIAKVIAEWQKADTEGSKGSANEKQKERLGVISGAAGDVLAALTGQSFEKPMEWSKWWRDNKRGFKLKEKPAEDEG